MLQRIPIIILIITTITVVIMIIVGIITARLITMDTPIIMDITGIITVHIIDATMDPITTTMEDTMDIIVGIMEAVIIGAVATTAVTTIDSVRLRSR